MGRPKGSKNMVGLAPQEMSPRAVAIVEQAMRGNRGGQEKVYGDPKGVGVVTDDWVQFPSWVKFIDPERHTTRLVNLSTVAEAFQQPSVHEGLPPEVVLVLTTGQLRLFTGDAAVELWKFLESKL